MLYNYFLIIVFGGIGVIGVIGVTSGRSDARVSLCRGELGSLSWPRQPLHTLLIINDHDDHDNHAR